MSINVIVSGIVAILVLGLLAGAGLGLTGSNTELLNPSMNQARAQELQQKTAEQQRRSDIELNYLEAQRQQDLKFAADRQAVWLQVLGTLGFFLAIALSVAVLLIAYAGAYYLMQAARAKRPPPALAAQTITLPPATRGTGHSPPPSSCWSQTTTAARHPAGNGLGQS